LSGFEESLDAGANHILKSFDGDLPHRPGGTIAQAWNTAEILRAPRCSRRRAMRVLMLGWEFPPHISGGLGTACFGLTEGLAHHGVEVTFIVPRAHGDEDNRFVRILGANQVPVMHTVESPRRAPSQRGLARAAVSSIDASSGMPKCPRASRWSARAALAAERLEYAYLPRRCASCRSTARCSVFDRGALLDRV
jgi:hypothetical protein